MKKYEITIGRNTGIEAVTRANWKDLISALVLAGYEIYGDEDKIIFRLGVGDGDNIKEIEE